MYDAIIIGAGLSGLSAGMRLSFYDKRVLIIEQHHVAGGLNSYYQRDGRTIDVGLHAMTNFVNADSSRQAPLNKLLRALRLKLSDFDLVEQSFSRIAFGKTSLTFTNNFAHFDNDVKEKFPASQMAWEKLVSEINEYNDTTLTPPKLRAREKLAILPDKLLREMLLCPLMYYGNAEENEMDWTQFVTMWKAIFNGGFCRPRDGMKNLIAKLLQKYNDNGGEIRFRTRVEKITAKNNGVEVVLDNGEILAAKQIYSNAGAGETAQLCGENKTDNDGKLAFVELVLYFSAPLRGDNASIIFFNNSDDFIFRGADDFIDDCSGVICCPNHFNYSPPSDEYCLRVTALANYHQWTQLSSGDYSAMKKIASEKLINVAEKYYPQLRDNIIFSDFFTPKTIARYTMRRNGAIYGAPKKHRDGKTPFENVYLIGTDQGFLGIVGALLSGITITNLYGLE